MTGRRVMVTGVSGDIGRALVRSLSADARYETVIAVGSHPPKEPLGRAEFVRADIRNPLIGKVINTSEVDTVVHMTLSSLPLGSGGRAVSKEANVIGTMQLLAACQKAPSLRTLVVKSTAAVYGTSARDPAMFVEDMDAPGVNRGGYAKDAADVESYVRGFGRRRPDVSVTVLRFTNFLAPGIVTALSSYLSLPLAPTVFGFDPRLQICHARDALAVFQMAAEGGRPGVFNVGGDGVLLLSQALRRLGRPTIPLPPPAVSATGSVIRRLGLMDYSPEQLRFLEYGRVVDTARLREQFSYTPAYTTAQAFEEYAASHPGPLRASHTAARVEEGLLGLLARRRTVHA